MLPCGIEPALGCALLTPLRNDAGGVRHMAQRDLDHLVGRRHFKVERKVGRCLNPLKVFVADMAPVFAQVRSDAVAANRRNDLRRAHRIGMCPATRIADCRNVIDVYTQAEAGKGHGFARLPGFVTGTAASSSGTSPSA